MSGLEILVNGKAYPCVPTMGAMLRFKEATGREITEINAGSFTDMCTYLWCCCASASKRAGIEFGYSLMDFADNISPEDMQAWFDGVTEKDAGETEEGEKKSL